MVQDFVHQQYDVWVGNVMTPEERNRRIFILVTGEMSACFLTQKYPLSNGECVDSLMYTLIFFDYFFIYIYMICSCFFARVITPVVCQQTTMT